MNLDYEKTVDPNITCTNDNSCWSFYTCLILSNYHLLVNFSIVLQVFVFKWNCELEMKSSIFYRIQVRIISFCRAKQCLVLCAVEQHVKRTHTPATMQFLNREHYFTLIYPKITWKNDISKPILVDFEKCLTCGIYFSTVSAVVTLVQRPKKTLDITHSD